MRLSLRGALSFRSSHLRRYCASSTIKDTIVSCPFESDTYPKVNLYSHVFKRVSKHGSRIAIVDAISGREYTFNEVNENTSKFSSALNRIGFSRGNILSICCPNIPEYCSLFFGALASGGIVSTVNPAYTVEELSYQFKFSDTGFIATVPAALPTVREAAGKAGIEKIIVIGSEGESDGRGSKLISYHSLLEDSGSLFNPVAVNAKEVIPYSSGTTGPSKGVMLTHHNVISNIMQSQHSELMQFKGSSMLGIVPFFHGFGMVSVLLSSLHGGSKLVCLSRFEPELFLDSIHHYKTDILPIVPPLVLFLGDHPAVDNYDLSCVRQIISGGAPLGAVLAQRVKDRLNHGLMMRQIYGLTETTCATLTPKTLFREKRESVGVPIKNVEVKVVNPETNENLSTGEGGELWIRGPNVMKGYLNLPEATSNAITSDGWFRTGDLGHYDEDGCIYITDRLKELIKVKGLQVAPAELEALLQTHHKIADAAVIGVNHQRLGEAPRAYVVKKDPNLQEKEVKEYVAGRVAKHKHLVGGVEFVEGIPKTASGKIPRGNLLPTS